MRMETPPQELEKGLMPPKEERPAVVEKEPSTCRLRRAFMIFVWLFSVTGVFSLTAGYVADSPTISYMEKFAVVLTMIFGVLWNTIIALSALAM